MSIILKIIMDNYNLKSAKDIEKDHSVSFENFIDWNGAYDLIQYLNCYHVHGQLQNFLNQISVILEMIHIDLCQ